MATETTKSYFIRRIKRRVRIVPVKGQPDTFDLFTTPAANPVRGDIEVADQPAFDEILAGMGLIHLGVGRQFVNVLIRASHIERLVHGTAPSVQRLKRIKKK